MRYANIDEYEVSNGIGNGISLYVQGCNFHCPRCFNQSTWDFNGGKEWTEDVKEHFLKLVNRPYIKRVSLLGGSPLADKNLDDVLSLVKEIKTKFPDKIIYLYTGYEWEDIWSDSKIVIDDFTNKVHMDYQKRQEIVSMVDIVIDGRYEDDKKDLSLKFRGSSNQRIIDTKKSIQEGCVVLWNN